VSPPRVLFLGTKCEFSEIVFSRLVQQTARASGSIEPTIDLCAALLPGQDDNEGSYPRLRQNTKKANELPLFDAHRSPDIFQLADAQSIPIYEIGVLNDPDLTKLIDSFAVDIICVACYAERVPQNLLGIPTYGFLNVHPSLLPAYRGPDPLFWIMRDGVQSSAGGVTIHWMDAKWDNGPIAAQQTLKIPDGICGSEINRLCAHTGSELLGNVLTNLWQQSSSPNAVAELLRPQPAGGHYQSWPQRFDYALDLSWAAQRAYNFMRGTKTPWQPHFVRFGDEYIILDDALAVDMKRELAQPFEREGNEIQIQFSTGILRASVYN